MGHWDIEDGVKFICTMRRKIFTLFNDSHKQVLLHLATLNILWLLGLEHPNIMRARKRLSLHTQKTAVKSGAAQAAPVAPLLARAVPCDGSWELKDPEDQKDHP